MIVRGKVVRFLRIRDKKCDFIFSPEEQLPDTEQHDILCRGILPYTIPGMPLEIEIEADGPARFRVIQAKVFTDTRACGEYFLETVKGISQKTSSMLMEKLDGDISKLLEMEDPESFLKSIPGSSRYRDALLESIQKLVDSKELYQTLMSYGIEYPDVAKLESMYPENTLDNYKSHVYEANDRLGMDTYQSDYIAKHLGWNRLAPERMKAIIGYVLRLNESNGSTRMTIEKFKQEFLRFLKRSAWPRAISPVYALAIMNVMQEIRIDNGCLCFRKRYFQEQKICSHLRRIQGAVPKNHITEADIEAMEAKKGFTYLESQKKLFYSMNDHNVILMPGRPGTGKTTTIGGAIELFKRQHPDATVYLCAPTARAAQVIRESSGYPASTIHLLLGVTPYGGDFLGKNETNPLSCSLVIVDEMSMVDTEIFYLLLRAIPDGCQIILSGDPDQIESVGCGTVFKNLLDCGKFYTVYLNQFMRQAALSSIVANCSRILDGNGDLLQDDQFQIGFYKDDVSALAALKYYYDDSAPCMSQQILTTTRKGILGTESLNASYTDGRKGEACYVNGYTCFIGDKVLFTKTDYKAGYCNGDVGIIQSCSENTIRIQLGEKVLEFYSKGMSFLEPAYAITVHKSQGTEYENVYVLLPEKPTILLNRNILNTAFSRARKKVRVFAVGDALSIGAKNVMKRERDTWLYQLLMENDF